MGPGVPASLPKINPKNILVRGENVRNYVPSIENHKRPPI